MSGSQIQATGSAGGKLTGTPLVGTAIPANKPGGFGWEQIVQEGGPTKNTYTWGIANFDYLFNNPGIENPIVSKGEIVRFDYAGSILSFDQIQFFDKAGVNSYPMVFVNEATFLKDGKATFSAVSAVPIPPAFILLASGLLGLAAMRIKKR